jgi:predicted DCC family thiol-disulfide oxidoreductase YuxK
MNFPENKKIILFDGVCNLCSTSVLHIIKYDKKDTFRLVSIQSEKGKAILNYLGIDTNKTDSIVLYVPKVAYYYKSEAVIEIAQEMGGFHSLLAIFSVLPTSLCDGIYDFIAKNRYQWFGKKDNCMIPTPELNEKFL